MSGGRGAAVTGSPSRLRARLVGLARILAGGLVVLAVVVVAAPLLPGDHGPGLGTLAAHVGAAAVAVAGTAVAAARRTPAPVAVPAALVAPVATAAVLWPLWWA